MGLNYISYSLLICQMSHFPDFNAGFLFKNLLHHAFDTGFWSKNQGYG